MKVAVVGRSAHFWYRCQAFFNTISLDHTAIRTTDLSVDADVVFVHIDESEYDNIEPSGRKLVGISGYDAHRLCAFGRLRSVINKYDAFMKISWPMANVYPFPDYKRCFLDPALSSFPQNSCSDKLKRVFFLGRPNPSSNRVCQFKTLCDISLWDLFLEKWQENCSLEQNKDLREILSKPPKREDVVPAGTDLFGFVSDRVWACMQLKDCPWFFGGIDMSPWHDNKFPVSQSLFCPSVVTARMPEDQFWHALVTSKVSLCLGGTIELSTRIMESLAYKCVPILPETIYHRRWLNHLVPWENYLPLESSLDNLEEVCKMALEQNWDDMIDRNYEIYHTWYKLNDDKSLPAALWKEMKHDLAINGILL